jgi:hypothetical protein
MWAWGYRRSPGVARLASAPLMKSCENRYQIRSTIRTSHLPVSRWAHRIEMPGDSMRKNRNKPGG